MMDGEHADAAAREVLEPEQLAQRRRRSWIDAERARAERLRQRSRIGAWLGLLGAGAGAAVAWIRGGDLLHAMLAGGLIGILVGTAVGTFGAAFAQLKRGAPAPDGGSDTPRDHAHGGRK